MSVRAVDYSGDDGNACMYMTTLWDGVLLSANDVHRRYIEYNEPDKYEALVMNYCISGRCEVHLSDERSIYMKPGMMSFDYHKLTNDLFYPVERYTGIELIFLTDGGKTFYPLSDFGIDKTRLDDMLQNYSGCYIGDMPGECRELCVKLYNALVNCTMGEEELRYYTLSLLFRMTHGESSFDNKGAYVARKQKRVASLIEKKLTADLSQRITIASIADELGIADSTIKKYFEAVYGISVSEYLRGKRMALACELLRNTGDKIGSIALRCGYANQSKFGAAFKEYTGSTPFEYRVTNRGDKRNIIP